MMYCYQFHCRDVSAREALIGLLSEAGFEGFEEKEESFDLLAYIDESQEDVDRIKDISDQITVTYTRNVLEDKNWNEVWESGFQPVLIGNFAGIRAHFHESLKGVRYEIVITPKMSFGTGHHATTALVVEAMQYLDFRNPVVLDFGTGTGVLAILAEKLGAARVLAIDNDRWSVENTRENLIQNACERVEVSLADRVPEALKVHLVLANITRNVLTAHASDLVSCLLPGGCLVISGFFTEDVPALREIFESRGLQFARSADQNNWAVLTFKR